MNQTITLDNLLEAVIDETGVSHDDLCRYQRDPKIDQARGIYYLIARQHGSAIRRGFNVLNINEMTEEEIIKASIVYMNNEIDATFDDNKNHEDDKVCSFREIEIAFKEGAKWALGNQWNDASKELPEDGKKVFVLTENGNGSLNSVYTFNGNRKWHSNYKVAYWMPIPQLQKEETK